MKKLLPFFYSTLIIVLLSNNYSFGQSCSSTSQSIDDFTSICVNSGSTTTLHGYTIVFMSVISMDGVMSIGGLMLLRLKDLMDLLL